MADELQELTPSDQALVVGASAGQIVFVDDLEGKLAEFHKKLEPLDWEKTAAYNEGARAIQELTALKTTIESKRKS